MSTHTAMRATAPTLVTTITQPDNRPDILVRTVKGTVTILGVNGQPDVSIRTAGRRAKLPVLRKDGTVGLRRPRTDEERERVSLLQKVRAIIADPGFWEAARQVPGNDQRPLGQRGRPTDHPSWVMLLIVAIAAIAAQVGTQRAAVTFVADPGLWPLLRLLTQDYLPDGFRPAGTKRPTRHNLCDFNKKWVSAEWADIRDRYGKAVTGYAMTGAMKLGYFNPDQHLLYNDIDPKQWVTADGTVCQSPSSKIRAETDARTDPASGHHAHAGRDKYGSKFVLIETVSDDYRGQIILDVEHVAPKPGDQQGDEGATTITMLDRLKARAPASVAPPSTRCSAVTTCDTCTTTESSP